MIAIVSDLGSRFAQFTTEDDVISVAKETFGKGTIVPGRPIKKRSAELKTAVDKQREFFRNSDLGNNNSDHWNW